ncbi:replication restart helicase PriA [Pseudodesulfovibrio tunisiensis]|uniref:replication restart helicase PriA n=1 Tax=Pseudodesulfovibrio tunisiensis TaxID=463192 RepID=UPI001FB28628|nr:primosomal protein N' [Pseudodesulfovibrio tunisiensis]
MKDYWQVALLSPPYQALTYGRPDFFSALVPGQRVAVPLGRSCRAGIVIGPAESVPRGVALRPVLWPLERRPLLDADYMDMIGNLASRQMIPLGRILEGALPRGLRTAAVTFAVDRHMADRPLPASLKPTEIVKLSVEDQRCLMNLWLDGRMRVRVDPKREAEDRFVSLLSDPPWPVRPNAKRQLRLLEHLMDNGPQSLFSLKFSLGEWTKDAAAKLEGAGLVSVGELTPDDLAHVDEGGGACVGPAEWGYEFTPEQSAALKRLGPALESGGTHLVHGVTGSGKTVVYLELARQCLEAGKSVLLLAPEVALACSLYKTVAAHFPEARTAFYHGYQSPKKRELTFRDLAREQTPSVVVGTRSALFLPMRNLGLIVLDEEHDESFKQEERLPYHAKEVAWFRVGMTRGLLVLGSATPDVKTFHAAREGHIPMCSLKERVGDSRLPDVELVDITNLKNPDQPFAPRTLEALRETVAAGEQAIVMLNRRGYSPVMYCLDCGETVKCPECEVGMTYHKRQERLVCHYCGHAKSYPLLCAKCGGANFLPMGEGTERLEESIAAVLPDDVKVLRLDRDATRRQERMEEILAAFARREAQVLVGTQMISKGHHFPDVTLVAVADGDLGLNLPDYRSSERTFQLLVQVAGRAGRGGKAGRVLIQTRNPGHPIWTEVISGDYEGFYAREIERRQKFRYPPFIKLGLVRISFPADFSDGPGAMMDFSRILREQGPGLCVLGMGPAPAPLSRLRGRMRFNCLLKADSWGAVRGLFARLERANPAPGKIRLSLDLDPVSTL